MCILLYFYLGDSEFNLCIEWPARLPDLNPLNLKLHIIYLDDLLEERTINEHKDGRHCAVTVNIVKISWSNSRVASAI